MAASNAAAATTIEISSLLKVKKLSDKAMLPSVAGYDLSSAADVVVLAHGTALVPTDLSIAIPHGAYARIVPRSGLPLPPSIDVGAGVIHADYRGPVGVVLFNRSDDDFAVKPGDRVAQIIIQVIDVAHPVGGGDTGAAVAFDGEAKITLYKSMPFRLASGLRCSLSARDFLLINSDHHLGCQRLALLSVGPRPTADLEYAIEIHKVGGWRRVMESGSMRCTLCWTGTDDRRNFHLLVPDSWWSSSDSLSVTVRVWKKGEAPSDVVDSDSDVELDLL